MKPVWNKIQEKLIMKVISVLLVAASTHWTSWKSAVYVAEIEPHYQIPVDADWKCSLIEGNGLGKRTSTRNARLLQKLLIPWPDFG